MIVTVVVDAPNGSLRVLFVLKVDKRESSRHLRVLILGQKYAINFAERLEQLHEIGLGGFLGQIRNTNSKVIFIFEFKQKIPIIQSTQSR